MDMRVLTSAIRSEQMKVHKALNKKKAETESLLNSSYTAKNSSTTLKNEFHYDSVSISHSINSESDSPSSYPLPVMARGDITDDQKLQIEEERDEIMMGKMTYLKSSTLDGTGSEMDGAREMFLRYLGMDECMMVWHVPPNSLSAQKLQVVLIWRGNSSNTHEFYSSNDSIVASSLSKKERDKLNKGFKFKKNGKEKRRGIVMETAQSDLDTNSIMLLLQNYLDALHAHSSPQRVTLTTDALRSLSCALSISEFLTIVPPHVKSFVVCCPPALRVIPWHLLLIEVNNTVSNVGKDRFVSGKTNDPIVNKIPVSSNSSLNESPKDEYRSFKLPINSSPSNMSLRQEASKYHLNSSTNPLSKTMVEVHFMERYAVRMGPTLTLFELCAITASKLKVSNSTSSYKTIFIISYI